MKRLVLLLAAGLVLLPLLATAQERLVSTATWVVSSDEIALRYAFPRQIARLLTKPGEAVASTRTMGSYLLERAAVTQDAKPCAPLDQGFDLGLVDARYAGPDLYEFEILFRCPAASGALTLRNDALFDLGRPHIELATIRVGDAAPVRRIITTGNREVRFPSAHPPDPSGPGTYIALGMEHLLGSLVHWCAIGGLLLLLRGRRELTFLAAGISGGYLIAAALSGLGSLVLRLSPAEAWDGFLVLLTAALFTARGTGASGTAAVALAAVSAAIAAIATLRGQSSIALMLAGAGVFGASLVYCWHKLEDKPARWLVPAAIIGLMDGLSFPSAFAPLHARVNMDALHTGVFNIGAILAVLAIFCATVVARITIRRYAGFLTRPLAGDLLTAALTAVGCFCALAA